MTENATADMLAGAAANLITAADGLPVEQLRKLAQKQRDHLDSDGLVERKRRQQQSNI